MCASLSGAISTTMGLPMGCGAGCYKRTRNIKDVLKQQKEKINIAVKKKKKNFYDKKKVHFSTT